MNKKIILLHKDKKQLEMIEQAQGIVIKCRGYNHQSIPEFIINYAKLKEVV